LRDSGKSFALSKRTGSKLDMPFEIKGALSPKFNAIFENSTEYFAPTLRCLKRTHFGLSQTFRPEWGKCAVSASCNGIFRNPFCRSKVTTDKIMGPAAGRSDDCSAAIELCNAVDLGVSDDEQGQHSPARLNS